MPIIRVDICERPPNFGNFQAARNVRILADKLVVIEVDESER